MTYPTITLRDAAQHFVAAIEADSDVFDIDAARESLDDLRLALLVSDLEERSVFIEKKRMLHARR